uniref:Uncharacterized protein n=1 Tax=Tanacetum cinerariifolium TaxID=118510 RepID=A0A6L2KA11_TANCI|nr:hypothetical protein [Tanacetum cinerariifolium]
MDVDAPPDIIDVDEDDDFIYDEDVVPHDLPDSDDEVLANDDVDDMSAAVARGQDGGDDPSPLHKIRFEFSNKGTLLHRDDHAAQWSNLVGEIVMEFLMNYPSWHKIEEILLPDGTCDVESIKSRPPENIKQEKWDKQIHYWLETKHAARALQNAQNREKRRSSADRDPDGELQDSRVPVLHPNLLRHTYCCRQICAGQGGDDPAEGSRLQYNDRVLAGQGRDVISINEPQCTYTYADVNELELQHEVDGGSGSDGGGDDDLGADEDADGDEEANEDEES